MKYIISNYDFTFETKSLGIEGYAFNDKLSKIPLSLKSLYKIKNIITPKEYLNLNYNLKTLLDMNYTNFASVNKDLRDYQFNGVRFILKGFELFNACGLFWEPRTGKTRTTVFATNKFNKILCVCLAGQEQNWVSTYQEFSDKKILFFKKFNLEKRKAIYEEFNKANNVVLVVSINTISKDILSDNKLIKSCDVLVIDEIHKARNTKTALNAGIRKLTYKAQYCLGLTGTPVSRADSDVLDIISILFKRVYTKTYLGHYFFDTFEDPYSGYDCYEKVRNDRKEEWLEFLALHFSQIDKSKVMSWINKPNHKVIKLELSGKQKAMYERCFFKFEVEDIKDNEVIQIQEVIAQFSYLKTISNFPTTYQPKLIGVKEEYIVNFLENYEGDGVIIFSTSTSFLEYLHTKLTKYKPCLITGKTTNKTQIALDFQNQKYNVVLANIVAASKGLTLDRADTIIFVDLDWRPDENQQAKERFSATTKQQEKFREIIELQAVLKIQTDFGEFESIDEYIKKIVENKITKTQLVNKFKELYKRLKGIEYE